MRLAVLGIFTIDANLHQRSSIRKTWLHGHRDSNGFESPAMAVLTRFVVRGVGASSNMSSEAASYGDIVFVRGKAGMSRKTGPLQTLVLWLACSLKAVSGDSIPCSTCYANKLHKLNISSHAA